MTLLTDASSLPGLSAIEGGFDDIVVAEAPDAEARVRSRHLKTKARHFVNGHFLFLDSDTIVCGDLSPLTAKTADLAAVADQHRNTPALVDLEEEVFKACGWRPPRRVSLNSGVVYWRDTSAAHALAASWHEKWQTCWHVTGRHNDQQALNSAIEDGNATVIELAADYNAQLGLRPEKAFDARIWHIFASDRGRVPTFRTVFDRYWNCDAPIELSELSRLFSRPHPFSVRGPLDALVVSLLSRRRSEANLPFDDWRRLWLAGDRISAFKALGRVARFAARQRLKEFVKRWTAGAWHP
ncbi:putative nucleotide-diphospho-sugar transferase [Limibaculum sp. FT325]|uniref:putative nucleotide-diphospho-sugar transferase n=1 Tax=Thermohalobaculum sediminis TaxID=2939436 RepID=UPI0020BEB6F2|nr:putative nucleotide-diphospho-sugar transferase [Limibaculum sediminis]MCL5776866.1 putative nucleotide-diphospho-sugar transferase [Limibaculum sediminis]